MNITVVTANGKVFVRPDTTREHDADDFYVPGDVDELTWSPVLVAHVSRACKAVAPRFASRYVDALGFGVLLYPENMIDGSVEGFACANCLDHTSYILTPELPCKAEELSFALRRGGETVFSRAGFDFAMVADALARVSARCLLRRGDFIAVELQQRAHLCSRAEGGCEMVELHDGAQACNWRVIF